MALSRPRSTTRGLGARVERWLEVSSCSNFRDYRPPDGDPLRRDRREAGAGAHAERLRLALPRTVAASSRPINSRTAAWSCRSAAELHAHRSNRRLRGSRVAASDGHRLVTIADAPELWWPFDELCSSVCRSSCSTIRLQLVLGCLRTDWPEFQIALLDAADGCGRPTRADRVDGTDEDLPEDGMLSSSARFRSGGRRKPGTLGLQIVVAPDRRARG